MDVAVAAKKVQLSEELLDVYKYWVLKRVAGGQQAPSASQGGGRGAERPVRGGH